MDKEEQLLIVWKTTAIVLSVLVLLALFIKIYYPQMENKKDIGDIKVPTSDYNAIGNLIQDNHISQFVLCDIELNKCSKLKVG